MTTPAPTLPAGWTPTVSGCLRTDDFWIWNYGGVDDQRTVLGGPSQTTNCFPSTWNPASPYTGWTCPRDYTIACQGTDSISAITCCPTAYDFTCAIPSSGQTVNTHGSWFPCISQVRPPRLVFIFSILFFCVVVVVSASCSSRRWHAALASIDFEAVRRPEEEEICLETRAIQVASSRHT